MFDRAAQIGAGRGVIDDQRQANLVGNRRYSVKVGDIAAGVGDGFAKDRPGVFVDGSFEGGQIVGVHEFGGPAELADRVRELLYGAAIKPGRCNDIAAGAHQREKGHDLGGMSGRTAHSTSPAFQRANTVGQRRDSRVRQAGIDVANLLQVEELGCVVSVAKNIRRGLVNRDLTGTRCRIRGGASMDLKGVEAKGRGFGHGSLRCLGRRAG